MQVLFMLRSELLKRLQSLSNFDKQGTDRNVKGTCQMKLMNRWILAVIFVTVLTQSSSSDSSESQTSSPSSDRCNSSSWALSIGSHFSKKKFSKNSKDVFANSNNGTCDNKPRYSHLDPCDTDIDGFFKECKHIRSETEKMEKKLANEGKVRKPNARCRDLYLNRNTKSDPSNRKGEKKALAFEFVTDKILKKYCLTVEELHHDLPSRRVVGDNFDRARKDCKRARPDPKCDSGSKYRTADGTCNNLDNPRWGSNGTCFKRMLPARYVGTSGFRQSVFGGALPNPRQLSLNIHNNLNRPTNFISHMFMFFGQLLDHDITQAPLSVTTDNQEIQCCDQKGDLHPQCAPILMRRDDPFFSQFGTTCLNLVRSAVCPTCTLGNREQLNQITAYIDGSFIYGNELSITRNLRANDGTGRLRVERSDQGDMLPPNPNPPSGADQCSFANTSDICFEAGDSRVNQHTTLASLQTVFAREHNRLANELRKINPRWSGETIFQETRRIVGAEMQVITYQEFLPVALGSEHMSRFDLRLSKYHTRYDDSVDAGIYTEFSTAAFRFGHSLISSVVSQSAPGNFLRDEFFQPFSLRTGVVGQLLQGVATTAAQVFDRHVVQDVTNFLYRTRGQPSGHDLAATNLQRGRDHGLPTYSQMAENCSENKFSIGNFNDLVSNKIMSKENARLLQKNYRDVRDVDLWTGVLAETYKDDAVLGPTGACIIGRQFHNLKFGDRFYFEHRYQKGSFTYKQIKELKKVTLSKIICANTDATEMPLNAMLLKNKKNPIIKCKKVKNLDVSHWKN